MQRAHEAGKWLAGYLSYEAGYLLEPKLKELLPENRKAPLLCFGVFDGPSDEALHTRSDDNIAYLREPVAQWSLEDYQPKFARLHQHLREGDCYQGNLTFRFMLNGTAIRSCCSTRSQSVSLFAMRPIAISVARSSCRVRRNSSLKWMAKALSKPIR